MTHHEMFPPYVETKDELVRRIRALDPDKVLACPDAFGLFKVEGFKCDDLSPSLGQAAWAFSIVKSELKKAAR